LRHGGIHESLSYYFFLYSLVLSLLFSLCDQLHFISVY
jgi:hypothetical protein